ncbi:MAG: SCP2 sterol-binding domain-containing protein [Burkholderiales bacterium]|nr:SCP2 sterol-binding domain-containing protein [Burkholderiales bacterium]
MLPKLPVPIAALVARLPQWPPSAMFALALNLASGRVLSPSALAALDGKCIRLRVRDAGLVLTLCYSNDRFMPVTGRQGADLEIAADADAFLALALGREDADTLFFNRRLLFSGDTELGLILRNALEAGEWRLPMLPGGPR